MEQPSAPTQAPAPEAPAAAPVAAPAHLVATPVAPAVFLPVKKTTLKQAGVTLGMVAVVAALNAAIAFLSNNPDLFNPVVGGGIYFILEFLANWLNPSVPNA